MPKVKFVVEGNGLSPAAMPLTDLADILKGLDDTLKALIDQYYPDTDSGSVVVGLVNVMTGSVKCEISGPLVIRNICEDHFGPALDSKDLTGFSSQATKGVRTIHKVLAKHNASFTLISTNGSDHALGRINFDDELITLDDQLISGHTTLYGFLNISGGEKPHADIRLASGVLVKCSVSNREVAKELGLHLYNEIGVTGIAKWDSQTWEVKSFAIEGIAPYEHGSTVDALNELNQSSGGAWLDIEDVDEAIHVIRSGGNF